ncbi:MAG: hypothetical protein ACKOCN_01010 [Planctomycetaceae bacterium]
MLRNSPKRQIISGAMLIALVNCSSIAMAEEPNNDANNAIAQNDATRILAPGVASFKGVRSQKND